MGLYLEERQQIAKALRRFVSDELAETTAYKDFLRRIIKVFEDRGLTDLAPSERQTFLELLESATEE